MDSATAILIDDANPLAQANADLLYSAALHGNDADFVAAILRHDPEAEFWHDRHQVVHPKPNPVPAAL